MGRHNIQFKGLRHSPSDITGQDGDLLECVNLIHDNGELKPIEMPERTRINGKLKNGNAVLVAVHNLTDGNKFVFALFDGNGTVVSYKNDGNNTEINIKTIAGEQIQWAETIGNTLIIGTDKSTHYALYKNGAYKWLGDKLPQPVFDFKIGWAQDSEKYHDIYEPNPPCKNIVGDYIDGGGVSPDFQNDLAFYQGPHYTTLENVERENKEAIRDNFKAKMAELLNSARKNNRFVFPFFVRYALRLYDNTYVMHSSPLLMLPSTDKCPILALVSIFNDITVDTSSWIQGNNDHHTAVGNIVVKSYSQGLAYKNFGFYDSNNRSMSASEVSEWEDVIKGVDVFLSSEIQTYNPEYYDELDNVPTVFHHNPISTDYGNLFMDNGKSAWWNGFFGNNNPYETEMRNMGGGSGQTGGDVYKHHVFPVPQYSKEHVVEKLNGTNLFFRVKQYELKKVLDAWGDYKFLHNEVEYGTLERLETLPALPDDYVSRSRITGKADYNYNQKLLLGNILLESPLWYKFTEWEQNGWSVEMCFVIEKKDKTIFVRADNTSGHVPYYRFGHYIFYPDTDCKRCIVHLVSNYDAGKYVIPMQEHAGLNGAFAIMPDLDCLLDSIYKTDDEGNPLFEPYSDDLPDQSSNRYYSMPNTIAMSSVANPFHFPASNFKDIGRNKVIGIAANTLDVSSGQWGQYPLYVFCSDGIIAVMIDGEGKFGGIQAVSADVLREPLGLSKPTLVQTGQMLMFLTRRGVMAIAGTKIQCVSEAMEGRHFNTIRELPDAGQNVGSFVSFIRESSDDTDFRDYAASAFLAYDYAHNRVLVIRPDRDYQYVYALKTELR